jgi:hypothetical protein
MRERRTNVERKHRRTAAAIGSTADPEFCDRSATVRQFPAARELHEELSCAARGLSNMRYDWPIVSAFVVVGLLIACSVGTGLYAAFGPPGAVEALVSMAAE